MNPGVFVFFLSRVAALGARPQPVGCVILGLAVAMLCYLPQSHATVTGRQEPGVSVCIDLLSQNPAPPKKIISKSITAAMTEFVRATADLEEAKILNTLPAATIGALQVELNKKEFELRTTLGDETFEELKNQILKADSRAHSERITITNVNEARSRNDEENQIQTHHIDGSQAIFHRIAPGAFMRGKMPNPGETDMRTPVEITKPFGMMATPVTQIIYKKVAELANLKILKKVEINVDPSEYKGDLRPVEMVSGRDVRLWISVLNELSQAGEPALVDIIPGWKKGKKYRLPTDAEWEFVVRGCGVWVGDYPDGITPENLHQFAKMNSHTNYGTENVASREPIIVERMPFYSLLGNVWMWMEDAWDGISPLPGGNDPVGTMGIHRIIRGGHWNDAPRSMRIYNRSNFLPHRTSRTVGFRLVEE